MPIPNDLFRRARTRLPSRQTPGACLSRQELAELVNQWIFTHIGRVVELDDNYIGKLERGVIRWPGRRYRQAFRTVLRVESDAQLGFCGQRRRSANVTDVDRQQFLRTAGALASLPWLELFAPVEPTPLPPRVTPVEINQIRAAATIFSSWDYEHGGGLAREAVFAQLRWAAALLDADCERAFRPELFAAVAVLAETAGFMAFDAGAHDEARRAFRFALGCAEQSPNWQMRASVLADMARQAVWLNDPDSALTFVELALARSDRLTATERAMLHTVRARALARLTDRKMPWLLSVWRTRRSRTPSHPAIPRGWPTTTMPSTTATPDMPCSTWPFGDDEPRQLSVWLTRWPITPTPTPAHEPSPAPSSRVCS